MKKVNQVPKNVQVGPFNFTVKLVENLTANDKKADGYIDFENCEILLEENVSDDVKKVTLLHEVLHAILMQAGIDSSEDNIIHQAINVIAMGIIDILRRNPDVHKFVI